MPLVGNVVELVVPGTAVGVPPVPLFSPTIEDPCAELGREREIGEGVGSQDVAVIQMRRVL